MTEILWEQNATELVWLVDGEGLMARGPTDQLFVLGRVEDLSQLEDERRGLESALWFFWLHYK